LKSIIISYDESINLIAAQRGILCLDIKISSISELN